MHPTAFAESIAGGGGTPWLLQQQPTNRQPNNGNSSKTYLKPLLKKIPTLPNPLDIGTRCVNLRKILLCIAGDQICLVSYNPTITKELSGMPKYHNTSLALEAKIKLQTASDKWKAVVNRVDHKTTIFPCVCDT